METVVYLLGEARTVKAVMHIESAYKREFENNPMLYCNLAAAIKRINAVEQMKISLTPIHLMN